jgi:hypothetical protein
MYSVQYSTSYDPSLHKCMFPILIQAYSVHAFCSTDDWAARNRLEISMDRCVRSTYLTTVLRTDSTVLYDTVRKITDLLTEYRQSKCLFDASIIISESMSMESLARVYLRTGGNIRLENKKWIGEIEETRDCHHDSISSDMSFFTDVCTPSIALVRVQYSTCAV